MASLPTTSKELFEYATARVKAYKPSRRADKLMATQCLEIVPALDLLFSELSTTSRMRIEVYEYGSPNPKYPTTRNLGLRIHFSPQLPPILCPGFPVYVSGVPLTTITHLRTATGECSGSPTVSIFTPAELAALGISAAAAERFPKFPMKPYPRASKVIVSAHITTGSEGMWLDTTEQGIWEALESIGKVICLNKTGRLAQATSSATGTGSSLDVWDEVSTDSDTDSDDDDDDDDEEQREVAVMTADECAALADLTPSSAGGDEVISVAFRGKRDDLLREIARADGTPSAASAREATSAEPETLYPNYSKIRSGLEVLYDDPIRFDSAALKERLKERGIAYDQFTQMRKALTKEKSADAIPHAAYAPRGSKFPPRRSSTYSRLDFSQAVESHIVLLLAEGEIELDDVARYTREHGCAPVLVLMYVQDSAGRTINMLRVTHGVVIPVGAVNIGRLAVVLTLWMHFGPFADIHRRAIMAGSVGRKLEALTEQPLLGYRVRLINGSDYGETPKMYQTPDLYAPGPTLPWVAADTQGYGFCTRPCCPRCNFTKLRLCSLPSETTLPTRMTPPAIRGRASLRLEPYYGVLHEMSNSVNTLAHDIVSWCDRKYEVTQDADYQRAGDAVAAIWPRSGGYLPRGGEKDADIDDEGKEALGEVDEVREAGGRLDCYPRPKPKKKAKAKAKAAAAKTGAGGAAGAAASGAGDGGGECRKTSPTAEDEEDAPVKGTHTVRPKQMKAYLVQPEEEERIAALLKGPKFRVGRPVEKGGDGESFEVADLWGRAHTHVRRIWKPRDNGITARADVPPAALEGRRVVEDWKWMDAETFPWTSSTLVAADTTPSWVSKGLDEGNIKSREDLVDHLKHLHFDASKTAFGVAAHLVFEHGFDIFLDDEIPFAAAAKLTEEAADHFFVYLYYLVPAIHPRSLTTAANAAAVWQVTTEVQTLGCPTSTNPGFAAKVQRNDAYA